MKAKSKGGSRPHGEIRMSQIVGGFGPGALVDLPDHAGIISGLEHWKGPQRQIHEERLVRYLEEHLEIEPLRLFTPPTADIEGKDPRANGIIVWKFPNWYVAQYEEEGKDGFRARPLVHRLKLVEGKYLDPDKKKRDVVPVRFVQACVNGHVDDIDWYGYVHGSGSDCRRQLWMNERGTSGDLADVFIRCDCGKTRSMVDASKLSMQALGFCRGTRPWLGPASKERCGGDAGKSELNRLLVRFASDAYFGLTISVISIPDPDAALRKAVDPVWEDFLQYVETTDDLTRERKKAKVANALGDLKDKAVLAEIKRRKSKAPPIEKTVKQAESEMLLDSPEELGEDTPEGDFFARRLKLASPKPKLLEPIDRVVLVHRMREVTVQVGFTRFESPMIDIDGELSLDVRRAELATDTTWLPAVENRGEGVFLAFRKDAIESWWKRPEVRARQKQLESGFNAWKATHPDSSMSAPSATYVMLHSLSHLLITAVSLECGYAASSIRERIYVGEAGFGILLHTGTTDSEGTLGGLVQVGRHIEDHLRNALELGRLCSNDPVCAQHAPDDRHEERYLHGAACHGCLLIAEPSCERRNEFLDRALVVPTVDATGAEFFALDE